MTDTVDKVDGTQRLCQAIYGHDAKPKYYLGHSDARMLHDAAALIESQREVVSKAEMIADLSIDMGDYTWVLTDRFDELKALLND